MNLADTNGGGIEGACCGSFVLGATHERIVSDETPDDGATRSRTSREPDRIASLVGMASRSERQAARETVAAYHETQLGELAKHVGGAIDRFRAGELDAFEIDQVMFQYSRAAKELWKFCNLPQVEFVASDVRDGVNVNWWERGAPKRRR